MNGIRQPESRQSNLSPKQQARHRPEPLAAALFRAMLDAVADRDYEAAKLFRRRLFALGWSCVPRVNALGDGGPPR